MILVKRIYEPPADSDGYRVLVDRLWPRGIAREKARIDEWLKDLSPSEALRKWFGHEPGKFPEFKRRYIEELSPPECQAQIARLAEMAKAGDVTLVYSARDSEHNNAVVLAELIGRSMKMG